jgi:hypothetical protein
VLFQAQRLSAPTIKPRPNSFFAMRLMPTNNALNFVPEQERGAGSQLDDD